MKKILLLFFILLTCSCEIQYDGETRIIVQGQVVDRNNKPIPNKKVEISTLSESSFVSSDLISYTTTDENGRFTLIFPSPKSEDISIGTAINDYGNNEFQSKIIKGSKKNFTNYKLDLKQIVLYEIKDITELEVILNKTSNSKQVSNIQIEGVKPDYFIDLNAATVENQWSENRFNVVKNQNINLSYTITDYSDPAKVVTTNHNSVITINSEKVIHYITY